MSLGRYLSNLLYLCMDDCRTLKVLFQQGRTKVSLAQYPNRFGAQKVVVKRTDLRGASLETRKLAIQEAHLLKSLKHPNIIKCLGFEEEFESITIFMEWAELGDLSVAWSRNGTLLEQTEGVMTITIQLLLCLRHLHSLGIIHRDVKTKNILASRLHPSSSGMRVKLGDFGIARMTRSSGGMARTTIGTPFYSSPEIFSGTPYDFKSDIWSLGCVIYEVIAGVRPFQSDEFRDLSHKVRHCTYPPLSKYPHVLHSLIHTIEFYHREVPFGLRDIVDSMLQPDAKLRPSASDLLCHQFVREHCMRLYNQLQTFIETKQHPKEVLNGSSSKFYEKYYELKAKLGVRGAAETFVTLMAPDLSPELKRLKSDDEFLQVAFTAWNRAQHVPDSSLSKTSDSCTTVESVQELTMTIRDIGFFSQQKQPRGFIRDPVKLRDEILTKVRSWDEFRLIHSMLLNGIDKTKMASLIGVTRYKTLSDSGVISMLENLISIEEEFEVDNI